MFPCVRLMPRFDGRVSAIASKQEQIESQLDSLRQLVKVCVCVCVFVVSVCNGNSCTPGESI